MIFNLAKGVSKLFSLERPKPSPGEIQDYLYHSAISLVEEKAIAYLREEELGLYDDRTWFMKIIDCEEKLIDALEKRSESRLYDALTSFSHVIIFRGIEEPENSEENLALLETDFKKAVEHLREDGYHDEASQLGKGWRDEWENFDRRSPQGRILPVRAMALAQAGIDELTYESSVVIPDYNVYRDGNLFLARLLNLSILSWQGGDYSICMETLGEFSKFQHL